MEGSEAGGTPDYLGRSLGRFLEDTASREPAPGGGAAAAVVVALAAGLVGMAARFSDGRVPDAAALAVQADALRARAAPLAAADATAYGAVLAAYAESRGTDPDAVDARRQRIRAALAEAAAVPLAVAEVGAQVAALADRVARDGNPNLRGDAVTGALLAQAGVRAAAALVAANSTPGRDDDRLREAETLVAAASRSADRALATG